MSPAPAFPVQALAFNMSFLRTLPQALRIGSWRIREYLEFDSVLSKKLLGLVTLSLAAAYFTLGRRAKGFAQLAKLHRSAFSPSATKLIERLLTNRDHSGAGGTLRPWLAPLCQNHIEQSVGNPAVAKFVKEPHKLFESMAIVLKPPAHGERGVLLLGYSYIFPTLLKLFDVNKIASRYYIVLEPSWSGYCDLDILCYAQFPGPVFVQTPEPRDRQFLLDTAKNLIPVPVGANWWVDHRVFRPLPEGKKDADVVMVAGWGKYKRHFRFFSALGQLKKQGHRLKAILVGYPISATKADIQKLADYYGVLDWLEFHERLKPEQVNEQFNRAKINLLWSRREGFSRAVIEGMLAGLPCIQRAGFNYGYCHPYINAQTGIYCREEELPKALLDMSQNYGSYATREWIMKHMTCQKAADILDDAIGSIAIKAGEPWTKGLVTKASALNGMRYWDPEDRRRLEQAYIELQSALRKA
jgi:glycosyltransferase involved in cell wall biosynthesis